MVAQNTDADIKKAALELFIYPLPFNQIKRRDQDLMRVSSPNFQLRKKQPGFLLLQGGHIIAQNRNRIKLRLNILHFGSNAKSNF
jgi:hypothetical protein